VTSMAMLRNNCFQAAWRFIIDASNAGCDDPYLLVHGDVGYLVDSGQINHAWVETMDGVAAIEVSRRLVSELRRKWPDGYSADHPAAGRVRHVVIPRAAYYRHMCVQMCHRYTVADVREMLSKCHHFGPWDAGA
jgi:hypothetical protein